MKAITFLGAKSSSKTTYAMADGRSHEANTFGIALCRFIDDLDVRVFVTDGARRANLASFIRDTEDYARTVTDVSIPDGNNTEQLWEVFEAVIDNVDEGEEVVFDITHGFRSLPFLAFLAAAYLRSARKVTVRHIFYGAYEAKTPDNISPVFDLSPFVNLLDWITATDQFVTTGDARRLAGLLMPSREVSRERREAASALERASLAAFLCQPFQLMPEAAALAEKLEAVTPSLQGAVAPFGVLKDEIAATFGAFGAAEGASLEDQLRAQYHMIEWYVSNNQLIQALTLAREWLISAVTWKLGKPLALDRDSRGAMERAVSGQSMLGRRFVDLSTKEKRLFDESDLNDEGRSVAQWPEAKQIAKLWDIVTSPRNTLDHAGHNNSAMEIFSDKQRNIPDHVKDKIMPLLRELAQAWGLLN